MSLVKNDEAEPESPSESKVRRGCERRRKADNITQANIRSSCARIAQSRFATWGFARLRSDTAAYHEISRHDASLVTTARHYKVCSNEAEAGQYLDAAHKN